MRVGDRLTEPAAIPVGKASTPTCHRFLSYLIREDTGEAMIVLGIILLVLGFVFSIHILWILGIIALAIGVILAIAGFAGGEVAGRRHWY